MGPIPDLVAGVADTPSDWYHPIYYSRPSDPLYTVHCMRAWGRCAVEGLRVRVPSQARPAGGGDGHMAVIDQTDGWEYDLWQVQNKPVGGGTLTTSWGGRTRLAGDGLGSDATAAHFGLAAGVIRAAELQAGRIDHALFIVTACTADHYVYPAEGTATTCANQTDVPSVGQRLWLDMTAEQIDRLSAPGWKKTILHALATYGGYIGDTGGNEALGLQIESGSSFTSYGLPDPMVDFAKQTFVAQKRWGVALPAGVTYERGTWHFDLASGVDWAGHLRVLDPCTADGTC